MMMILLTFVLNILKIKIAQEHKFDRTRSYAVVDSEAAEAEAEAEAEAK